MPNKCATKDRNGNPCRAYAIIIGGDDNESRFCKNHLYMNDYTEEMLAATKLCGGCKKMYFIADDGKTCDKCRSRGGENRDIKHAVVVICTHKDCPYQIFETTEFCKRHQPKSYIEETLAAGLKLCVNHIRGCRAQLEPSYAFTKCKDCLQKDREIDNAKRESATQVRQFCGNGDGLVTMVCTVCVQDKPTEDFHGMYGITKTCKACRDDNKIQDARRDREHRLELGRIGEKKRECLFNRCLKSAQKRKIAFYLSFDEFCAIIEKPCAYCGIIDESIPNGVDRKNSDMAYSVDNCVSACQICNYMKGSLSVSVFYKRIVHILSYHRKIKNPLYFPEIFPDHFATPYIKYANKATIKEMPFELTLEDYENMICMDCYICGKKSGDFHTNGIDRFVNDLGYVTGNMRSCCFECNIMKQEYSFDDIIDKMQRTYDVCSLVQIIENLSSDGENTKIMSRAGNKKTG